MEVKNEERHKQLLKAIENIPKRQNDEIDEILITLPIENKEDLLELEGNLKQKTNSVQFVCTFIYILTNFQSIYIVIRIYYYC